MTERKVVKLGELYEVHNGLSKGREFFGSGYPFLSFSTVFNHFFIPDELTDLVQSTEIEQNNYSIRRGDIFITRTSETSDELGMSCVALKDYPTATYNGFTKRMRPITDLVLPEFIGYYMRTPEFRGEFLAFSTMTTRASLKNEDLLSISIALPSLEQQKRIANILIAYDNLIDNNQKQIKLLEEAAQRLYKEWFVDLRFPGYETTPIVDGVPEGWAFKELESQITLYSGFAFKSADFCDDGQYRIITIKNVKDGQFIPDDTNKMKEIPSQMPNHCKLNDGDILLSLTGNVGRVCLVFGEGFLLNQRVAKLQSNHPGFTYCLFRSKDMFDTMSNLANGAAQQNLSPVRTGKTKVLFPSVEIQQSFETIVFPMLKHIVSLNKEISTAVIARDLLLQKLMNREIEV